MTNEQLDKANRLDHKIYHLTNEIEQFEEGIELVKADNEAYVLFKGHLKIQVPVDKIIPILTNHLGELKQQLEALQKEFEAL